MFFNPLYSQTPQEFQKEYEQLCNQKEVKSSRFHGFAYDGIWVVTTALARVMEAVSHNEKYHNYTVSDEELSLMLVEAMSQTTFLGVTVSIKTFLTLDNVKILLSRKLL